MIIAIGLRHLIIFPEGGEAINILWNGPLWNNQTQITASIYAICRINAGVR